MSLQSVEATFIDDIPYYHSGILQCLKFIMYSLLYKLTLNIITRGPRATMLTWVNSYKNILDFQLPWQQIKMRNLYNFFMLGGGYSTNIYKKGSVKIPAVR